MECDTKKNVDLQNLIKNSLKKAGKNIGNVDYNKLLWKKGDPPIAEGFETLIEPFSNDNKSTEINKFMNDNKETLKSFMENHPWIKNDSKHETQVAIWFMNEHANFLKNKTSYSTLEFFEFLNKLHFLLGKEKTISDIKSIPIPTLTTAKSTTKPTAKSTTKPTAKSTAKPTAKPTPTPVKKNQTPSSKINCDKEREKAKKELKKDMGYIKEFVYRVMSLPFFVLIIYNVYYMFFSKSDFSYKDGEGKESGTKIMTDFGCKHHPFHDWEFTFRDMEKGYTKIATEFLFKPTLLFSVCMTSIQNSTTLNTFNQKYPYLMIALLILLFYSFYSTFMDEISKVFAGVKNMSIPTNSYFYNFAKTITWWYFAWRCIDSWIWFFIPLPFINPYLHIEATDIPVIFPVIIKFILKILLWVLKQMFTAMLLPLSTFILVLYVIVYFVFGIFKNEPTRNVRQGMSFIDQFIYTRLHEKIINETPSNSWYKNEYNIVLKILFYIYSYFVEIIFFVLLFSSTYKCVDGIKSQYLKSIFSMIFIVFCLLLGIWTALKEKYNINPLQFHYDKEELGINENDEATYEDNRKSYRVNLDEKKCKSADWETSPMQHMGIFFSFLRDYQLTHDTMFTELYKKFMNVFKGNQNGEDDKMGIMDGILKKVLPKSTYENYKKTSEQILEKIKDADNIANNLSNSVIPTSIPASIPTSISELSNSLPATLPTSISESLSKSLPATLPTSISELSKSLPATLPTMESLPKTNEMMDSITNSLGNTTTSVLQRAGKILNDPNIDTKDPLVKEQMDLLNGNKQKLQELLQNIST